MLRKALVVALFLAAVLVPAAGAAHKRKPHVDLRLLPLQETLPLQWQDSGFVTNQDASEFASGLVTPKQLKKLGRVLGYALDYGDPFTGGAGVNEIKTSVDEYNTARDTSRGLAFWHKHSARFSTFALGGAGVTLTVKKLKPRRLGQGDFSYLIAEQNASASPIYFVDEQAREGRYILEVRVGAGSQSAAVADASSLARKLDARVRNAIAGRLHGSPVTIPDPPDSGPPPGGPDLSNLVLQPSDVGQAKIQNLFQGYDTAPYAISDYGMLLSPAGPYDLLSQELSWYATPTEATQIAAYASPLAGGSFTVSGSGTSNFSFTYTPVDVSSAGDNATAENVEFNSSGLNFFFFSFLTLRKGQLVDSVTLFGENPPDQAALLSVAEATASRLDAGYSG